MSPGVARLRHAAMSELTEVAFLGREDRF